MFENFKDFEYPLNTLETNLLGASMLLHMVQVLFKVRLLIKNMTQTFAQKLDSLG